MLLDFCEEDVKDAFTIFKDRFLIRKLLREIRSTSQTTQSQPDNVGSSVDLSQSSVSGSNKRTHGDTVEATELSKRVKISENNFIKSNFHKSQTHNQQLDLSRNQNHTASSFMPTIVSVRGANQTYFQQSSLADDGSKRTPVKQENIGYRFNRQCSNATSVSSSTKLTPVMSKYVDMAPSDRRNLESLKRPSPISNERISSSKSETIEIDVDDASDVSGNVSSSIDNVSANAIDFSLYYGGYESVKADEGPNDFLIVSSTISQYSADELLEKKVVRTKPTEAQRLGHILIRNAAQSAKIWNTAPLLKDIPEDQKEMFFNFVFAAAPQLRKKPDLVWCRIREALQNRRKYLMDKETGKRYPKSTELKQQLDPLEPGDSGIVEVDVKPELSSM